MNLEELGRRVVACPRWRWMPGMTILGSKGRRVVVIGLSNTPEATSGMNIRAIEPNELPDLSSPATLGCLLHLVREAYKSRFGLMVVSAQTNIRGEWYCNPNSGGPKAKWHATEAEALVVALEAAP